MTNLGQIIFGHFPRSCYSAVAEFLTAFLKRRNNGRFPYVCGVSAEPKGRGLSHSLQIEREGIENARTRASFAISLHMNKRPFAGGCNGELCDAAHHGPLGSYTPKAIRERSPTSVYAECMVCVAHPQKTVG